jgi:hypothetical protein
MLRDGSVNNQASRIKVPMVSSKPKDDVRCIRRAVCSIVKHTQEVVHDAFFA